MYKLTLIASLAAGTIAGQPFAAKPEKTSSSTSIPDMSGVWQGPYTPDLTKPLGHDLPYSALGAERFKNVVHADDPTIRLRIVWQSGQRGESRRRWRSRLCNRRVWP